MRIALLCSGLGNIYRGHEIFARDLFNLMKDAVDITLFKGGGEFKEKEWVINNIFRNAACLDHIHTEAVSPKWANAVKEQERTRIEEETFAYAALKLLLEGNFDVVHCLEGVVCNIVYDHRHLFKNTPKILFSNGGAIRARDLPRCDFVQEHTEYNLRNSNRKKSFMIPHGVDVQRFNPLIKSDFRIQHGIPQDVFVAISVGTICYWHKRMDYVIREIAPLKDMYLVIIGQENDDTPAIKELGRRLMGDRILFTKLPHDELPKAYAASDIFVLGSLFETFGIVYIEAMAMGLPVICTNHINQRSIVKEGIFIDMKKSGELTQALRDTDRAIFTKFSQLGPKIVLEHYDLRSLKEKYIERYRFIASIEFDLPTYSFKTKIVANLKNAIKQSIKLLKMY